MTQSNFEKNGGTYTQVGDYLIPDLVLPSEEQNIHLGVWGMRYKRYLKQNKKAILTAHFGNIFLKLTSRRKKCSIRL